MMDINRLQNLLEVIHATQSEFAAQLDPAKHEGFSYLDIYYDKFTWQFCWVGQCPQFVYLENMSNFVGLTVGFSKNPDYIIETSTFWDIVAELEKTYSFPDKKIWVDFNGPFDFEQSGDCLILNTNGSLASIAKEGLEENELVVLHDDEIAVLAQAFFCEKRQCWLARFKGAYYDL